MTAGRPVARLVAPVVTRVLVLGALLAGIAIAGVLLSTRSVHYVTDELQPAAEAHQLLLQDLSDMQGAVRAYAQAGRESSLDDYRLALSRFPDHRQQVRPYAEGDDDLAALLATEEDAAEAWLDDYARTRILRAGGPGTFDPELFSVGLQRFEEFRAAHDRTAAEFRDRLREARDQAGLRLRGTILAVVAIAALGAWGVARARRRLIAELAEPLEALEGVVQRMAAQDREVRAGPAGPREVRAVAYALNDLADAQARASAVEDRIQHELRNLDTAKDDFVANVSHELRTPLTTISGYLELVAEEFEDRMSPRHERMVDASRRNVSRLRLLIDDLLTLSRAENRDTTMERVDLGGVVEDVVTDVRMTATRRGIRIDVTRPEGEQLVLGDRAMLHRALLNVLSNAVKFSHDRSRVEVGLDLDGEEWRVRVQDHGIGIPRSEIERLGTRFFRASNAVSNEIAGTGLGVRIIQTIIDKHMGDVVVESTEGEGTLVSVRLPAQAGASARPVRSAAELPVPERGAVPDAAVALRD